MDFEAMVKAATGHDLRDIPDVEAEALLSGQILVYRDGCYVVTVGYPISEDPETGAEIYGAFGVVDRWRAV